MIQMRDPIETAELLAFTRTIEAKSLSRAAAELGVPRATVGRRLARLEGRLGARLLRRTTRALSLTDAGEQFYRQARIVLDTLTQAQATFGAKADVLRGDLRVSVPPLVGPSFQTMVTAFAKAHPQVRVQVDFSTRVVDLQREGYDVALRASADIQPGLVARMVARQQVIAVASPEYLSDMGRPRTLKELRRHRCLTGFARGELPQSAWPVGRGVVHVEAAFSSNDVFMLREAAVNGLGIAMLPRTLVGELLERGALIHVLPGVLQGENRVAVVYLEREFLPPHVRSFVDRLIQWSATLRLLPDPPSPQSSMRRRKIVKTERRRR
jgi:DNA-binding transcriptional LysR family regulator